MKSSFIVLILLFLVSCSFNYGKFTVLSTKPIDLSNFTVSTSSKETEKIIGGDFIYFFMGTLYGDTTSGKKNNSDVYPKIALDNAFKKTDKVILTNASIKYKYFMLPPFYFHIGFVVDGEVAK